MTGQTPGTAPGNFLPNFCSLRSAFVVLVSAELLAMVLALAGEASPADFWPALALRSLYVQWIAVLATVALCALRRPLSRLSHGAAGAAAWTVITLTAAGVAVAATRLVPQPFEPWAFAARTVAVAAIVAALLLRYLYVQHMQRERAVAASRARFEALQARIRPHFLFNSMNTIAQLTRADPALAEAVVEDLADLFRATLADAGRLTTLPEELDLTRAYLRIEAQRLGPRLRVAWDLQGLPDDARVPQLILQPLVENAVYHGIEPAAEGGVITVAGRFRRGTVNLSVRNTRPPPGAGAHRSGNRMAVENVRARLAVRYGDEATLTVGQVDGEYQVRLTIPHPFVEEEA
ncbi:MAG: histidine kinase [Gammaproteobacteria bacterium]|jgi:two-component system sensor histidine kinase AlgZ|nr:histidine kinase [Gammaproteobacteria bacterium]